MYDVVIVGAGASGLMCASTLIHDNSKLKVLLLEKNDKIGKKLSLTGNGRCNLGNLNKDILNYNSNGDLKRFEDDIKESLYLNYLKDFGIYIKEENNLLYPYSNQAISVVKSFERYLKDKKVDIKYDYVVTNISKENNNFIINNDIKCKALVIATGGMSYPKTGSTGDGYNLVKKYHNITKLFPSLVSLISDYKYLKDLSGVRIDANLKLICDDKVKEEENGQLQFTNYGISGICTFNISRNVKEYLESKKSVYVKTNLAPNINDKDFISFIRKFNNYRIEEALSNVFNNKLSNVIAKDLGILGKRVKTLDSIDNIIEKVHNFKINIIDTKDYNSAQVTKGGVNLDELKDSLESKKCKGMYIIGEVLDVDGKCGGYNLSWCFTSALIAAKDIIDKKI